MLRSASPELVARSLILRISQLIANCSPTWPAMFWLRLCFLLPWSSRFAARAATCLLDGIPEEQRQNITMAGVSMPIGVAYGNWDSAMLVTSVYQILASEVLGFHVRNKSVSNSLHQLLAVSGCTGQDMSLCSWPPTEHLALEAWQRVVEGASWRDFSEQLAERSGATLAPVGYEGYDGMHVLGRANRRSQEATGMHLTFYGNYNATWFQPETYAATISEVNMSLLQTCNITDVGYPEGAQLYLDATGDNDGVEVRNGKNAYKCWLDEKWWLAPACRPDPANCISIVTGSKGWGIEDMSQKAAFFNMKVGIAVASSNDEWRAINRDLQSLLYAWSPDASFVIYEQRPVQFPARQEAEIAQGIYRSMNARSTLWKANAPGLGVASTRALGLAENLRFSSAEIDALLVELVSSTAGDPWMTACDWIKSHREAWEVWVPERTTCALGRGLVDLQGNFVTSKAQAVDCEMCLPGRVSLASENTRVCSPCASGSFQNAFGASECKVCELGTVTAQAGLTECVKCSLGRYANMTGMSSCFQCGALGEIGNDDTWTTSEVVEGGLDDHIIEILGASSSSQCFCKENYFLFQGRCEPCGDGLICPGMNRLSLSPGYFSWSHEPSSVYRCFNDEFCPGGPAGSCAAGRDNQSLACNDCLDGMRDSWDGTCVNCTGADYGLFITICIGIPIGIVFLYIGLKREHQKQSGSGSMLMVGSLQLLLITVQMLSVVRRFDVDWREPFASILVFLEVLSFDIEMLNVSCVTSMGPVALFGARTLLIPLLMFGIFVVHVCFLLCTRSKTFQGSNLWRTCGTTFLVFFIILFSMLLAPFQCFEHPNGTSSLKRYETIQCGESHHTEMFIIGGFACLMPVLFLAICTWVVLVQLPARLARSDARFLETCSFLIRRFRPGAEIFSVLFLVRNVLVVLCPLAPNASGQLTMMNLLFYVNLFGVAYFKPWRVPSLNLLDSIMLLGMMLILDLGSITTEDSNPIASMTMALTFLGLMVFAIILALLLGGYQHLQQKYRKQFRFFTCHQKNAAGSMARFLKMELELCIPGTKTFIDCDDLTDLTRLFSYVGQDTETFLVLGSPAILTRKWCVGEIVTARRNNVKTVLLSWPEFVLPDKRFIEEYPTLVPDIPELTNYGIGLSDVAEAFRWLCTVPSHKLPERFGPSSTFPLLNALCGLSQRQAGDWQTFATDCPVLANPDDTEAMATAMVLSSMLKPKLLGTSLPVPSVLEEDNKVPEGAQVALMICSSNCWKSAQVQHWLLQISQRPSCALIPVIAEDNFLVPSPSIYEELRATSLLDESDFKRYCLVIKALFQEIAIVFVPQNYSSTHDDLLLRASQAAMRLQATLTPLAEKVKLMEARRDSIKKIDNVDEANQEANKDEVIADKEVEFKDWKDDPLCGETL